LSSGLVAFFGSAPSGAILPSRPARWCGRRAAAVKDGRILRPPGGLVLDGREHADGLVCVGIDRQRVMPALLGEHDTRLWRVVRRR
jgi:hypothetical protein